MIRILVLPDSNPQKYLKEGQKWAFFKYWPESVYHIDMINAFQIPYFSEKFEKKIFNLFIIQSIKAFLTRHKYDLIVVHGSVRNFALIGYLKYLFGFKSPKLAVFDIGCFGRVKGGIRLKLIEKVAKAIDCVIHHAKGQESYYEKYLPQLRGKYYFVPLGIYPYDKTIKWEESRKSDYIITLGHQSGIYRDWKTLIGYWKEFIQINKNYRLMIIGKSGFDKGDIEERSILPLIEFRNYLPVNELAPLVEQAQFAVLPLCEREHAHGQLTLLYLMSMGKTVIVADTIGVKDYVDDGETGIFYKTGNSSDLLEKIKYLIKYPQETERIGKNAYRAVRERFNERCFSERTYEILSGI